jgi:hypothetical protein
MPAVMAEGVVREPFFRSRGAWVLLFVAYFSTFYALHGSRITPDAASPERFFLLTGDEPHYLLVAHSLAFDGDFDLYDNLKREDYRAFSDRPVSGYVKNRQWVLERVCRRSTLRDKPDGYWERRALPTQPIGTSVLIAPAYRLGQGWGGRIRYVVALFFHALLAVLALVMTGLCWRFTGERPIAVAGGIALSAPLLFYSVPAFPDLPAALLIALGVLLLSGMRDDGGRPALALALGCCSAALPWVHLRFLPSALLLLIAAAWPPRGRRRSVAVVAVLALPWVVSLAALARFYQLLFGHPWPVSTAPPFSIAIALGSGWPGLLFDRDHGLLAYAPLAVFALPGAFVLLREGRRAGVAAVALLAAYIGLVGANAGWNGGLSPPLRYWVPAMPLVALAIAVAVSRTPRRGARMAALFLGALGPAVAVWGMLHPKLLYSSRHPVLAQGPWTKLWTRLPVFFPEAGVKELAFAALAGIALCLFARWVLTRPALPSADGQPTPASPEATPGPRP